MTSATPFRSAVAHPTSSDVLIAGVAWPVYKLVALLSGFVVLGAVTMVSTTTAPAVLSGAATAAAVWWLGLALRHSATNRSGH